MAIVSPFTGQALAVKTSFYNVIVDDSTHIKNNQTLGDAVDVLISLYSAMPNAGTFTITNGSKTVNFNNISSMNKDQLMAYFNNN